MHIHTNCSDLLKALQDLCCCCSPVWDFSVWHVGFQWLRLWWFMERSGLMYCRLNATTSMQPHLEWMLSEVNIKWYIFQSQFSYFPLSNFPSRVTTANDLCASDPIIWILFSCDNNFEPRFTSSINLLFSLPLDLLSHSSTDIFYPAFLNIQIISFWVLRLISKTRNMQCLRNLSIHITAKESQNLNLWYLKHCLLPQKHGRPWSH